MDVFHLGVDAVVNVEKYDDMSECWWGGGGHLIASILNRCILPKCDRNHVIEGAFVSICKMARYQLISWSLNYRHLAAVLLQVQVRCLLQVLQVLQVLQLREGMSLSALCSLSGLDLTDESAAQHSAF